MNRFVKGIAHLIVIGFCSCNITRTTPKYNFTEGYYYSNVNTSREKVFVVNLSDSILIYSIEKKTKSNYIDTSLRSKLSFPQYQSLVQISAYSFKQPSFDVDFLTMPFKLRPSVNKLPNQLNTNINGAIYIGYRNDIYRLSYNRNPVIGYNRKITHYGFSVGLFTGIGGTAMNPWVTNPSIFSEYDGVVLTKGLAGIIGVNNFTVGLSIGWDSLLDENKKSWIYQEKPWLGLAFGLNLN